MDREEAGGVLRQVPPKKHQKFSSKSTIGVLVPSFSSSSTIVIIYQIKSKGGMVVDNPPPSQKNATLTLPDAHVNSKSTLHPNWPFSSSSCDLSNRPTTTHHPPVCREKYSKVVSKKA